MSRLAIMVFARLDSNRLPGKVLADVNGRPLLGRVLDRLRRVQRCPRVVLATSHRPIDEPLAALGAAEGIEVFRGDGADVAGRAIDCCNTLGLAGLVRISGDSPFLPPELVDHAVDLFERAPADIVTNVFPRTYPPGASVEVIDAGALRRAHAGMSDFDKEHMTSLFYRAGTWQITNFVASEPWPAEVRLTVDTPQELVRAQAISSHLGPRPETASLDTVVAAWHAVAQASQEIAHS